MGVESQRVFPDAQSRHVSPLTIFRGIPPAYEAYTSSGGSMSVSEQMARVAAQIEGLVERTAEDRAERRSFESEVRSTLVEMQSRAVAIATVVEHHADTMKPLLALPISVANVESKITGATGELTKVHEKISAVEARIPSKLQAWTLAIAIVASLSAVYAFGEQLRDVASDVFKFSHSRPSDPQPPGPPRPSPG